jgi:uncharacterized protein YndB with AHSA1/START domain
MTREETSLTRTVLISARRATVFRYFTDARRFADWWGAGSSIEGRPGGALRIVYPNGVTVSGTVLEVEPETRVVFTYGYDAPGKPIPPGGSRVTVTLEDRPAGTLLTLRHDLPDAATRDAHLPGWRYQLSLFANVAAREEHSGAGATLDAYFAAWSEPDAARRAAALREVVAGEVSFHDALGCVAGLDELVGHIGACQVHMPGVTLLRDGEPRQCQGTALVAWVATDAAGQRRARGVNVFDLGPDGRITRVVGFPGDAEGRA